MKEGDLTEIEKNDLSAKSKSKKKILTSWEKKSLQVGVRWSS
jgi:hypothetical protein